MSKITRRTLVKAFPFFGAAMAMPAVVSAAPDGAVIPLEVAEAIADWNRKSDAVALAWSEYKNGPQGTFPHDNPRCCRWFDLREEVDDALTRVLRSIRETDLDVAAIYRGDST